MVCRGLDPWLERTIQKSGAGPVGRLLLSGRGRRRSLFRSLAGCAIGGPRQVGRESGRCREARLCRGCSPYGPAGPGVTGRRREASPGYSAARVEAAPPPSSPKEPALRSARAAVTSAPTLSNPASLA